jgi:ABC-type lipoprotein release transport system permease subunit
MALPIKYNLRNLVERKGTTLMTAVGIALTVAVLVTSIAMTRGMAKVFSGSGHPLQLLVLRKGVDAELSSTVKEENVQIVRQLPGIARTPDGEPMASPEGITVVNLPSVENPNGMNVTVRGMLPVGRAMRETAVLLNGRWNEPGKREVVVGEGIARRYPAARVGQTIKFGKGEWLVVGEFVNGDSANNSELWADLNQLRGDFEQQGGANSVLVRVENAAAVEAFKKAVEGDQRLGSAATEEKVYFQNLTKSSTGTMLQFIGFFVAVVMAVGAGFAATNTMYAAVARRSREIGTLRSIGFGRLAILTSFVFESVCLALIGGVLGILIALPLNNMSAGIGNFQTFSEMSFKFSIGPEAILGGLIFAATIGALGGFLPAWSASRKNIIAALREA